MDLKRFRTNTATEIDGRWEQLTDGSRIKVARWGNPKFVRALDDEQAPYRTLISSGKLPADIDRAILDRVAAKTILVDWEGLELDGEALDYSSDTAFLLLNDPELHEFRELVFNLARQGDGYRKEADKDELGN